MSESNLPEIVRRLASRAVGEAPAPERVRIRQEGEMWLKPGGRAMRFAATQVLAVGAVAFEWGARFPLAGPVALRVVDRYARGVGELVVGLLGVPLQRQRGPEVAAGEALRYLAELPWVPYALLANRELEWLELDDRRAEVATLVGGSRVAVVLEADAEGDVVAASSWMRKRKVGREWVETPWGGSFGGHERLGGIRVPTLAEVHWDLPGGRYVYFRARVTSLESLGPGEAVPVRGPLAP